VISRGVKLTLAGVFLGVLCALALTRYMRSLLFGINSTDPITFVAVAALLALVALAACFIPARRAGRVDLSPPCATNSAEARFAVQRNSKIESKRGEWLHIAPVHILGRPKPAVGPKQ